MATIEVDPDALYDFAERLRSMLVHETASAAIPGGPSGAISVSTRKLDSEMSREAETLTQAVDATAGKVRDAATAWGGAESGIGTALGWLRP